jgi:hypothetical protein
MRLTIKLGVAIGIAALTACAQSGQDNSTATDANAGMTADETVLPPDDSSAGADTLGNQLNQLNESEEAGNTTDTENAVENSSNAN